MSDDKKRTRFSAVVEELTATIKPTNKPAPGVLAKPSTPELFTPVIVFTNGVPSPCPKCGTSAFEPNWVSWTETREMKVLCRGCPLPSPIFDTEIWFNVDEPKPDAGAIKTKRYRCACLAESNVTIDIDQVNLYCGKCGRLAIHESLGPSTKKKAGMITVNKIRDRQRDISFSWVEPMTGLGYGRVSKSDDELRAEINDYLQVARADDRKNAIATVREGDDAVKNGLISQDEAIRLLATDYGASFKKGIEASKRDETRDINALADKFYTYRELKLLPWLAFASAQREKNRLNGVTNMNIERRTGRSTHGLMLALAEADIRKATTLWIRGATQMSDKMLVELAERLIRRLPVASPIREVKKMPESMERPIPADVAYFDHHFFEVRATTTINRVGRFR